jgi:hypothetical protein
VQTFADKLYLFYVQELESKPRKQMPFLVSTREDPRKRALSTVIAETEAFFTFQWQRILENAEHLVENFNIKHEPADNKYIQKIHKKRAYMDEIYKHHFNDYSCLGCVPHFIMNWNILDLGLNKTKIALIDKCSELIDGNADSKQKVQL